MDQQNMFLVIQIGVYIDIFLNRSTSQLAYYYYYLVISKLLHLFNLNKMAQQVAQKHMIEQYGPYGSQCPENYSFQLKEGESIKEVIIRHGFIVDAIGFVVAKPCGGTYTKMFGGNCGNQSKIVLKCGEKITQISGTYGNYKYMGNKCVIATMKIHTNLCPNGYGPYGQGRDVQCAQKFSSPLPLDGPVVGVFGRHNNYLESVGIFVKKMDCSCS